MTFTDFLCDHASTLGIMCVVALVIGVLAYGLGDIFDGPDTYL